MLGAFEDQVGGSVAGGEQVRVEDVRGWWQDTVGSCKASSQSNSAFSQRWEYFAEAWHHSYFKRFLSFLLCEMESIGY